MIIEQFAAGPWATNCYVIAPGPQSEAIIIDPGYQALSELERILTKNQLHPVAALLTHGHMDHVWSVVPLCKEHQVPAMIHKKDEWMLAQPELAYPAASWREIVALADNKVDFLPKDLNVIESDQLLKLAGLEIDALMAPGHTQGSLIFKVEKNLFSGDTLFNQGIGRTDLPGGDENLMRKTLKEVILPMDDEIKVFPGHGPTTKIGDERKRNLFLRELTK